MATNLADFYDAIVRQLSSVAAIPERLQQQLQSGDVGLALDAVQETLRDLTMSTKVIVETNGHGDPQRCVSNRQVELTFLRRYDDLFPFEDAGGIDLFVLKIAGEVDLEAAAARPPVEVDRRFVRQTCTAVDEHFAYRAWQNRASAEAELGVRRVFRIEWLDGYEAREPEVHHVTWFTPERGFDQQARNALLEIPVGGSDEGLEVFDRVRVTRVS